MYTSVNDDNLVVFVGSVVALYVYFAFFSCFISLTVNACNVFFLLCIHIDTSVNASNQVVSVGADIAFDADPKFFACLVRFESSSVPTTLPTAYDVYPLDGRHDGGYYTVKD